MPSSWTTADQKTWLQKKIQGYLEARGRGRGTRYAKSVHNEFSQKWPEREVLFPTVPDQSPRTLTTEEKEELDAFVKRRSGQILTWLQRNAAPRGRLANKAARNLLERHRPKRKRSNQATEIYGKLYPEKINSVYQERKTEGLSNGARLNLLRKIAEEQLENETEEVLAQVAKIQKEQRENRDTADQSDDEVELDDRSAEQLILDLPNLLTSVVGEAHKLLPDWGFLVLAAGPRRKVGHRTHVFDVYVGPKTLTTQYGFTEAYSKFDSNYRQPFGQFLRDCNDEFKYTHVIESEDESDPPHPPRRPKAKARLPSVTSEDVPSKNRVRVAPKEAPNTRDRITEDESDPPHPPRRPKAKARSSSVTPEDVPSKTRVRVAPKEAPKTRDGIKSDCPPPTSKTRKSRVPKLIETDEEDDVNDEPRVASARESVIGKESDDEDREPSVVPNMVINLFGEDSDEEDQGPSKKIPTPRDIVLDLFAEDGGDTDGGDGDSECPASVSDRQAQAKHLKEKVT